MKKEISSQVNYYNNKNKKQQITINKYILDEISVRFLVQIDESDFQNVERLFFILEEAHWFYIDNYREKNICFIDFCNLIVNHNSLQIDVNKGFKIFRNYKKGIKVFGCIIFDRSMENVLVVQEKRVGSYSFPKGKKNKNEEGVDCAIREVLEEIGYDVSQKIIKHVTFTIFEKMNFFFVLNVSKKIKFQSRLSNEIVNIFWLPIFKIEQNILGQKFTIITKSYHFWRNFYLSLLKNKFKFNSLKIIDKINRTYDECKQNSLMSFKKTEKRII